MNSHPSTLADVIRKLKSSPLFQLSLASKELFHSNFLAWICESYPDQVAPLFSDFLPQPPPAHVPLTVHREKGNIDLTICFPGGNQLVVENKVKSIPREEQLEEYAAKFGNKAQTGFLLLSLTRPGFLNEGKTAFSLNDVCWHYLSYGRLAELLQSIALTVSGLDTYHGALLTDYIEFITLLDVLHAHFAIDWEHEDADFFGMQEDLRQIRLHDLVDKLRFAELAWRVKGELKAEGFENVVMRNLPNGDTGQIAVFSDMTRGVGLFDMKYLLTNHEGNPVMLGVQVQGRDFRLNVEMKEGQFQSERIAESLLKPVRGTRIWFNFDSVPGDSGEYPKTGDKKFNQYSRIFWYRSKKLGKISPAKLVATIIHYARLIRDQQFAICQQIRDGSE